MGHRSRLDREREEGVGIVPDPDRVGRGKWGSVGLGFPQGGYGEEMGGTAGLMAGRLGHLAQLAGGSLSLFIFCFIKYKYNS